MGEPIYGNHSRAMWKANLTHCDMIVGIGIRDLLQSRQTLVGELSYDVIAKFTKCSRRQVVNSVKALDADNWLMTQRTGRRSALVYTLPSLVSTTPQKDIQALKKCTQCTTRMKKQASEKCTGCTTILKRSSSTKPEGMKTPHKQASGEPPPSARPGASTSMDPKAVEDQIRKNRLTHVRAELSKKCKQHKPLNALNVVDFWSAQYRNYGWDLSRRVDPTPRTKHNVKTWIHEFELAAHRCDVPRHCGNAACIDWPRAYELLSLVQWLMEHWTIVSARVKRAPKIQNNRSQDFQKVVRTLLGVDSVPTLEAMFLFRQDMSLIYQESRRG